MSDRKKKGRPRKDILELDDGTRLAVPPCGEPLVAMCRCGMEATRIDDIEEFFGWRRMKPEADYCVIQSSCRKCRAVAAKATAAKRRQAKKDAEA